MELDWKIEPLDEAAMTAARARQAQLAKPPGSLGRLEDLSVQLAGITGKVHNMDVTDAVKSYRSLQRRREILKDSHVGRFAVIGIVLLILAQFAAFASVPEGCDLRILILVPAVSRCCSALAVTGLPSMSTSQYADRQKPKSHLLVLAVMLGIFLLLGFVLSGRNGVVLPGVLIGYAFALRKGYRSLEGMNGDIAGYALTVGELRAVAVLALGGALWF